MCKPKGQSRESAANQSQFLYIEPEGGRSKSKLIDGDSEVVKKNAYGQNYGQNYDETTLPFASKRSPRRSSPTAT